MMQEKTAELVVSAYRRGELRLAAALAEQAGRCGGCGVGGWNEDLRLDEDHGIARGALCARCKPLLAATPNTLRRMAAYMEETWDDVKTARSESWAEALRGGSTISEIAATERLAPRVVESALRGVVKIEDIMKKFKELA